MFCKNCGAELLEGASFCTSCGTPIQEKKECLCAQCGGPLSEENAFCPHCGASTKQQSTQPNTNCAPITAGEPKSKLVAGLLGIFVGVFGVHNFYLGFTSKAVTQLILGVLGCTAPISAIWGLVEGIMILTSNDPRDAQGNPLKKDV